jgi:hypothetical protein
MLDHARAFGKTSAASADGAESASTRVMKTFIAVAALCVAVSATSSAYTPKYRARVTSLDRQTDFSKLKTYGWLESHIVVDTELDAQIVSAVDREFSTLGMRRTSADSADLVVTYAAYSRTDVNVKAKEIARDVRPSYAVGVLVVSVLAPKYMRTVLELRADTPVDRASRAAAVVDTVSEMFKLYPRPRSGH